MKKLFLFLILSAFTIMSSGCGLSSGKMYDYRMIFLNIGKFNIVNIKIESRDGQWSFFGEGSVLVPHAQAIHDGLFETRPDEQFIITWNDVAGQSHRAEVGMGEKVSRFFHGEMVFIIDGENRLRTEIYPKIRMFNPLKLR